MVQFDDAPKIKPTLAQPAQPAAKVVRNVTPARDNTEKEVLDLKHSLAKAAKKMEVTPISNTQPNPTDFNLSLKDAQKLLNGADGLVPYEKADWKTFPKRNVTEENAWGVGFTNSFKLANGAKGQKDHLLSDKEAKLASTQLSWDQDDGLNYKQHNPDPIKTDLARNGQYFLHGIFDPQGKIYKSLDANGDGQFGKNELKAVAALDGDASTISKADFDKSLDARFYVVKKNDKMEKVVKKDMETRNPSTPLSIGQIRQGTIDVLKTGGRTYGNSRAISEGEIFNLAAADAVLGKGLNGFI